MKIVIFFFFFLYTTCTFAQTNEWENVNWMVDCSFDMSSIQADSVLKIHRAKFQPDQSIGTERVYSLSSYNEFPVEVFNVSFKNDSLSEIHIKFHAVKPTEKIVFSKIVKRFQKMKSELTKKFGQYKFNDEQMTTWYYGENDKYSVTAAFPGDGSIVLKFNDRTKSSF
ncbi:MAG: hypothetical protein V4642_10805 [Bacteroidota bacterium]